MMRLAGRGVLGAVLMFCYPAETLSKTLDGMFLESASTLSRGAWNVKSYLEFGSGAEPVTASVGAGGTSVKLQVDSIRLPVEIRYGLADNWEVGGDLGFESDDGTQVTVAGVTTRHLDGSGLQRLRLLGKWNFWQDAAGIATLAFAGDNQLYYSLDSFDFGLKFAYSPQLGAGTLNLNLGLLIKGGDPDLGGTLASSVKYNTIFDYGIGYVYPYSDNFVGIFELAGATATYKNSGGVSTKGPFAFNVGARYGFTDRFYLDGGLGIGLGGGSPDFLLKVGMDWMWGTFEQYTSTTEASSTRWKPTETAGKTTTPAPTGATTPSTTKAPQKKDEPYYEPPAKYETPQPYKPPEPAKPSVDEQVATRVADAQASFGRGDFVSAAAHYEGAVKLKSTDPTLHYNLATTYFQMKKYADAKSSYKEAVRLNASDPDSHLYLGYTYYYLGDQASAIGEWQKVLQIDPSNTLARDNLKALGAE
ncbi:tetratricopeptide repeat protein [bacterium]|nr:tetratricopeptide repeat protein [bacterium]